MSTFEEAIMLKAAKDTSAELWLRNALERLRR